MPKILIADDDINFVRTLASTIRKQRGLTVLEATAGDEVLDLAGTYRDRLRCILLDYRFDNWCGAGQLNGLDIAEKLKTIAPWIEIVMLSGIAGISVVDEAHRLQHVRRFIDKSDMAALERELDLLFDATSGERAGSLESRGLLSKHNFHTSSPFVLDLCRDAVAAAHNGLSVLICGETGTGKTELARAIHGLGNNRKGGGGKFVPVNCASIAKDLIDSELFGHVKGAFTGADRDKEGLVEAATHGTLFLDEIVEMPIHVQAKLNHALEPGKGTYRRVGDTAVREVNARIIAATNVDVARSVAGGKLRQDLFYRFEQIITIPPLHKRPEDIPGLVMIVLCGPTAINDTGDRQTMLERLETLIERDALSLLQRQAWKGNVRQLNRVVKRAKQSAERSGGGTIESVHILEQLRFEHELESFAMSGEVHDVARHRYVQHVLKRERGPNGELVGGIDSVLEEFRKEVLIEILKETKGNVAKASRRLGRSKLTAWLRELHIDAEEFRE